MPSLPVARETPPGAAPALIAYEPKAAELAPEEEAASEPFSILPLPELVAKRPAHIVERPSAHTEAGERQWPEPGGPAPRADTLAQAYGRQQATHALDAPALRPVAVASLQFADRKSVV